MELIHKIKNFFWNRIFLYNVFGIILVYILFFFGYKSYLNSRTHIGQKIEVPNLIGKNLNNLGHFLENSDMGYQVLDSIYDPTKVEGTIIEQDPGPSEISNIYIKEGRVIKVRVSKRSQLVEMPSLVDKSQRYAENILRSRKFRYKLDYQPSRESHGAVLEQLYKGKPIKAEKRIPIGSRITLVIGRDETGVSVVLPNLYGLTIVEAKDRVKSIENIDFLAVCPSCLTYTDSLMAIVQSQSPEYSEGAIVSKGTTILVFAEKQ